MDWNWAAIEAVSSVIGGICVVVSVVFLIYEVRHNANAIEGATVQSLMSLEREVFAMLAAHADLFTRGCKDRSALSDEDRFRFDRVVSAEMSLVYSGYVQFNQRLMEEEVWEAYLNSVRRYTVNPGFVESWNSFKSGYPRSFRDLIDGSALPKA